MHIETDHLLWTPLLEVNKGLRVLVKKIDYLENLIVELIFLLLTRIMKLYKCKTSVNSNSKEVVS